MSGHHPDATSPGYHPTRAPRPGQTLGEHAISKEGRRIKQGGNSRPAGNERQSIEKDTVYRASPEDIDKAVDPRRASRHVVREQGAPGGLVPDGVSLTKSLPSPPKEIDRMGEMSKGPHDEGVGGHTTKEWGGL